MFSYDHTTPAWTGDVTYPRATSPDGTVVIVQHWSGEVGADFHYKTPDFGVSFSLHYDTAGAARRVIVVLNSVVRNNVVSSMDDEPLPIQQKVRADIAEVLAGWPGNPALGCEIDFVQEISRPAVRASRTAFSYDIVMRPDGWGREVPCARATSSDGTVVIVETWANDQGTSHTYDYAARDMLTTFQLDHRDWRRLLVSLDPVIRTLPFESLQRIKSDITDALRTWPGQATGDWRIDFRDA